MTNQELIKQIDDLQGLGEISFEQWWAMKCAVEKLGTGYTETEESCKGCMGPCGMCEDTVIQDVRELEEIVRLGAKMRTAQKAYFRNRTSERLEESKRLEREFDVRAAKKLDEKPEGLTLFGDVGDGV